MTDQPNGIFDRIERGIELEERAAAGDKRAAWELTAMDRDLGIEPRDHSQPKQPRARAPHMFAVERLVEREGEAVREAVEAGTLPTVEARDGEPCVLEDAFYRWLEWYQQPIDRHCPSCGHDLKGEPPGRVFS